MKNKNIVICSDGTGNVANKGRGTNVFKLYESVDTRPPRPEGGKTARSRAKGPARKQVPIYCDGVGTEKLKFLRAIGGAFGFGFSRNVRRLYVQILRVYEPGDAIYMFGFSRGAYTVRILAGLIGALGLPDRRLIRNPDSKPGQEKKLKPITVERFATEAYSAYRGKYRALLAPLWDLLGIRRWRWRSIKKLNEDYPPRVEDSQPIVMVGVWDTVDAVGFPVVGLATIWDRLIHGFRFRERGLTPKVAYARHALSLDDERRTFHPSLWQQPSRIDERIRQVWFAGVHSNVGGGYPKHGVSHRPLVWMMREAEDKGLDFLPGRVDEYERAVNVHDHVYDSRAGLACYYRYAPRDLKRICDENNTMPLIDVSVVERLIDSPQGYAPGGWPRGAMLVDAVKGREYPDAAKRIREALGESRHVLTKVEPWVVFRKVIQWGLILGSVFFLIVLAKSSGGVFRGLGDLAAAIWSGLKNGNQLVWIGLLSVLAAYLLGLLARVQIERHLARFWNQVRSRLERGRSKRLPASQPISSDAESPDKGKPFIPQWTSPVAHSLAAALLLAAVLFGGSWLLNWYASPSGIWPATWKCACYETISLQPPFERAMGYAPESAKTYMRELATCSPEPRSGCASDLTQKPKSDPPEPEPSLVNQRRATCFGSYQVLHRADNVFPLVYGLAFLIILMRALQLIRAARAALPVSGILVFLCACTLLLVLAVMFADWLENAIWTEQLDAFPRQEAGSKAAIDAAISEQRLETASLMTMIKMWGFMLAFGSSVILTGFVHASLRSARERDSRALDNVGLSGLEEAQQVATAEPVPGDTEGAPDTVDTAEDEGK